MKNLMNTKHVVATLVVAFFTVINAFGQKPNTFFITADDQKHYIYGDEITFWYGGFTYIGENGKKTEKKTEDVKLLYTGSKIFIGVPAGKKLEYMSLREIIAFNKNNLLLQQKIIESSGVPHTYIFIYKRDDLTRLEVMFKGKETDKIDYADHWMSLKKMKPLYSSTMTENMKKYFPECPELIEKQLKNIEDGFGVNAGISYYNCCNANDYFTNTPVEEKETKEEKKTIKEEEGYILTTKDEKLKASSILREPQDFIHYYEKVATSVYGGLKIIHAGKVKYFIFGKKLYLPFKNSKGAVYMMEILVYNNDKILVYDHSKKAYNVYDRNNVLLVSNVKKENILPVVQEHFSSCKDVVSQMEENVKFHREAQNGFSNFNCSNAPALITE